MTSEPIKDAISFIVRNVREHGWSATQGIREAAEKFKLSPHDLVTAWHEREIDWQREADYLADLANVRANQILQLKIRLNAAIEALRFCADEYADDLAIATLAEITKPHNGAAT